MNNRMLIGLILLVMGILVLIFPEFLRVIVGVGLIIAGLWIALQNSQGGGNI